MWCFRRNSEDTSHAQDDRAKDELIHEKGIAVVRKGQVDQKRNQGVRRLPTIFVRNKRPRKTALEHIASVAFLGLKLQSSAHEDYISKIQNHLARAYLDACGRDRVLTRAAFVRFMKDMQGEDVPESSLKEEYTDKEFMAEWIRNIGLGAVRPLSEGERDLSKPISNYFINSSHNTYLEGHQLYSASSSQIYKKVLDRHCRCIEIDVWDGDRDLHNPSRSRSPDPSHKRHHSSSSLEGMKHRIFPNSPRLPHGRNASAIEPMLGHSISAEETSSSTSSHTLDPDAVNDRLRPSLAVQQPTGNRSEPLVTHAYSWKPQESMWTLSNPVGFREVCKTVRDAAFASGNHLPVIVSLEVHCRFEQQEVMVKIMKEEWAGYLLDEPIDGCDPLERQPQLEELMDKILIKVKRSTPKSATPTPKATPRLHSTPKFSNLTVPTAVYDDDLSPSDDERCEKTGEKKTRICKALADLAIYTHSERFSAFDHPNTKSHSHIFSIGEKQIRELYEKQPQLLLEHNRRFMMRAYPDPYKRVRSDNPDPSIFWRKGVQMVALNWQDKDYDRMALNDAMFTEDTRGWVLKPKGYRSDDGPGQKPDARTLTLRITVYAGMYIELPKAIAEEDEHGDNVVATGAVTSDGPESKHFKPSVLVDLIVSNEKASKNLWKKTPARETVHPDWGPAGHCLEFVAVPDVVEELSFVRFKVCHEGRTRYRTAAWACIRLDRLRQGYRLVELMNCKGNNTTGRLFVKVEKQYRQPMGIVRAQTIKLWNSVRASTSSSRGSSS